MPARKLSGNEALLGDGPPPGALLFTVTNADNEDKCHRDDNQYVKRVGKTSGVLDSNSNTTLQQQEPEVLVYRNNNNELQSTNHSSTSTLTKTLTISSTNSNSIISSAASATSPKIEDLSQSNASSVSSETSSRHSTVSNDSALSLRYSAICSSISSLFTSNQSFPQQKTSSYDMTKEDQHDPYPPEENCPLTSVPAVGTDPCIQIINNTMPTVIPLDSASLSDSLSSSNQYSHSSLSSSSSNDDTIQCNTAIHTTCSSMANNPKLVQSDAISTDNADFGFESFLNVGRHLANFQNEEDDLEQYVLVDYTDAADGPESSFRNTNRSTELLFWKKFTDNDWDSFARTASEHLQIMLESEQRESSSTDQYEKKNEKMSKILPPIPPSPPTQYLLPVSSTQDENFPINRAHSIASISRLRKRLPPEFTCPLCSELIAGATSLNCGCNMATMCTSCLEIYNQKGATNSKDTKDKLSPTSSKSAHSFTKHLKWQTPPPFASSSFQHDSNGAEKKLCPSCDQAYNQCVPCRALDVAILHAVQQLTLNNTNRSLESNNTSTVMKKEKCDDAVKNYDKKTTNCKDDDFSTIPDIDIQFFQSVYYTRLLLWKEEVNRRRQQQHDAEDYKKQQLLSSYFAEEEEFYRRRQQQCHRDRVMEKAVGWDVMVTAAAITAILVRLMVARR